MLADTLQLSRADSMAGHLVHAAGPAWRGFTGHAFVRALADRSLPQSAFRRYLVQDYLFLIHYSRAWALAAFKSEAIADIQSCSAMVHALASEEMRLHIDYCASFGLTEAMMAQTPEHPANIAYTRFVMERGLAGDLLDLLTALAPCVIGYGEIGAAIIEDPGIRLDGHPYRAWIETYSGSDYRAVALAAIDQLDRIAAARLGPQPRRSPRWPSLVQTFETACRLEIGFWQMGLDAA